MGNADYYDPFGNLVSRNVGQQQSNIPAAMAVGAAIGAVTGAGYLINKGLKKTGIRSELLGAITGAGMGGAMAGPPGAIAGAGLGGFVTASIKDDIKALMKILHNRQERIRAEHSGLDAVSHELDYDFLSKKDVAVLRHAATT